jgi:hypothetical protein
MTARKVQHINARGAEAVLGPGVSRFSKRGSMRQPCTKGKKCRPLDRRGHQGLDGQRGMTRLRGCTESPDDGYDRWNQVERWEAPVEMF